LTDKNVLGTKEQLFSKTERLLEEEGAAGWKLAQEVILKEETTNTELNEAMQHIMLKSPPDYFRPAILSLCSKAVGGLSEVTIPTGASMVLFARAIGIHDDIIDQSKTKNNYVTIFGKFDRDVAIILADILLFKGFTLLRKTIELGVPTQRIVSILDVIERIWFAQSEGGILEIQARGKTCISPSVCLTKIKMIASETEVITRIGGLLGGGTKEAVDALGRYGRLLGLASILRNELIDVLDLKELRHRIKRESLPLPVVYAMQFSCAKSELVSLIGRKRLTTTVLREILRASDKVGGMNYVANLIAKTTQKAHSYITMFKHKEPTALELLLATLPVEPEEWKPILKNTN